MNPTFKDWLQDVIGAFVIGASHAGKAFLALVAGNYCNGDIPTIGWRGFLTIMLVSGLLELMKVLELNPLPGWSDRLKAKGTLPAALLAFCLLLPTAAAFCLMGCASDPAPKPVLSAEVQSDLAKVQERVAQAGESFAAWISQPANQRLVTSVATAAGKLAFVGEALAGVDASAIAAQRAQMWGWGKTFYSLQGGSVTVDQVNSALAATSSDLAGAASSYSQAFDLWNGLVASGITALQGFPDALRILLGCFAQAAMNVAGAPPAPSA